MKRKQITKEQVEYAKTYVSCHTDDVLQRKGYGSFSSRHEILGVIEDERRELVKNIQEKKQIESTRRDLADIAEICIFGIACIDNDGLDW